MAGIYDNCAVCGAGMTHPAGRGKAKKYCSHSCKLVAAAQRWAKKEFLPCRIDGCEEPATRIGAQMCEMHYCRLRRSGSDRRKVLAVPETTLHTHGYVLEYAPEHPLARSHPRVYQHRIVFYEEHGEGPFCCHWCGCKVTWGDMHVDHLNDVRSDNSRTNLVASCATCNQARGLHKMRRSMKVMRGVHLSAHGVTMCIADWARHLGLSRSAIEFRLARGWRMENALSPRSGKSGPMSMRERVPLDRLSVLGDERLDKSNPWAC
jgi:hypothetical protein